MALGLGDVVGPCLVVEVWVRLEGSMMVVLEQRLVGEVEELKAMNGQLMRQMRYVQLALLVKVRDHLVLLMVAAVVERVQLALAMDCHICMDHNHRRLVLLREVEEESILLGRVELREAVVAALAVQNLEAAAVVRLV